MINSQTKIRISVIVPIYNADRYLTQCLDSILAQTFTDFEAICVNDGSSDNSLTILREYVRKDSRIKIINQKNQGVVIARNNGVKQATGKYIFPLDPDDMIANTLLEKAYEAIEQNKGDIITCRVVYFGAKQGELVLRKPNKYNMAKDDCLVNAGLFKKSDFEKIGGYDIAFTDGLEDYDLWLNMLFRLNLKIYRIEEILFFYRIKDEQESRNLQQRKHTHELRKIMLKKYPTMRFYICLYRLLHFFADYKIKDEKKYIKILGFSFRINK